MNRYELTFPEHGYFRLGPLSMNVCSSRVITDASVAEYMDATLGATKGEATVVSLSYFVHDVPNARQRQAMMSALERYGVAPPIRTCLLTDSSLMRGALTAFRWLTRGETDCFAPADVRVALAWLAQRAPFDVDQAVAGYASCCARAGLAAGAKARPGAG